MNNKKGKWLLFLYLLLLIAVITSPFSLWQLKEHHKLDVLIIDKTVPDKTYREHKGLMWMLNNNKIVKSTGEEYKLATDYVGFHPKEDKTFETTSLPSDLKKYDLIYIADQYGVYEQEFYGDNPRGARSESLYGGLQVEEVTQLRDSLIHNGGTLITEFNTFASPTSLQARTQMYDVLNLKWSGWIGRYFYDLGSEEVPIWVIQNYEEQTNEKWLLKGEGIVLVDQFDTVVVLSGKDLNSSLVQFSFSAKGIKEFSSESSVSYQYWFDIIEARDSEEIMANYDINVSQTGKEKLAKYHIPSTFPAIIKHENSRYTSYYFAGDYADNEEIPGIYKTVFYSWLKGMFTFDQPGSTTTFYWKVYVPMMKEILKNGLHQEQKQTKVEVATVGDITFNGHVGKEQLQVLRNGKWEDLLIKGVNIGMGKPGAFPGEAAITKEEYFRWFKYIGDMNANAIRVYTLNSPSFYEALYEYNQIASDPLYLFHGIWVLEEEFHESGDAFSAKVTKPYKEEARNIINAVHGNATILEKRGHASGHYQYDVSDYLLGWIVGIEWDPNVVLNTNEKNKNVQVYNGEYFKTEGASPFECWLAEMMDYTAKYEAEQYQYQHMMSFTNWPTTDLLTHMFEPSENEDKVTVNPNNIYAKDSFYPGLFASYHIYPYYPDFMNYEPNYTEYIDHRGEKNSYAGYLNEFIQAHRMPVLVAEFGIPASRGLTHKNVDGKNQGFHSESEQGQLVANLFEDIVKEGYAGGVVFSWQDEWFKRTWNTMDYDNPNRRPYWSNIQTNEQYFGFLSFDPGVEESTIHVDGQMWDWEKNNVEPLYHSQVSQNMSRMFVHSDTKYLYIRLDYEELDKEAVNTMIFIDSIKDQGNSKLPQNIPMKNKVEFDFYINISNKVNGEILVDRYYDSFYYHYGEKLNMIPIEQDSINKNSGQYNPIRLVLNKKNNIQLPDGSTKEYPFEMYETGTLLLGNSNPTSKEYNSLADYHVSEGNDMVEIRIPWQLLNVKDPSLHEVMGDMWKNGLEASSQTNGFTMFALQYDDNNSIQSSLPHIKDGEVNQNELSTYKWDGWDLPIYHERLKESYYYIKQHFGEYE